MSRMDSEGRSGTVPAQTGRMAMAGAGSQGAPIPGTTLVDEVAKSGGDSAPVDTLAESPAVVGPGGYDPAAQGYQPIPTQSIMRRLTMHNDDAGFDEGRALASAEKLHQKLINGGFNELMKSLGMPHV